MTTNIAEITCLIGQSNASGIALEEQLFDSHHGAFADAYIYNFNTNQLENLEFGVNNDLSQPDNPYQPFGMEMAWGELAPQLSDNMQVMIKQAVGGTALFYEWNVANGGDQYLSFRSQLDTAIPMLEAQGYEVRIKSIIQVAGESDALSFDSMSNFESNMYDLIDSIYDNYGAYMTDTTWYITEMRSPYFTYGYSEEILAIQQNIAANDGRVELINTEGSQYVEPTLIQVHYNSLSLAEIMRKTLQTEYGLSDAEMTALNLDDGSGASFLNPPPIVHGTSGDDTGLQGNYVIGWEGADEICGTQLIDRLFGHDGDDSINGLDGNDQIGGGDGDDYIYGSAGDDLIYGEEGNDTLLGGLGNDTIVGGKDNDVIVGDAGEDKLIGDIGNDYINGGLDNDKLYGGYGDDNLQGNIGDDMIFGDAGNDYLVGGDGIDSIFGGEGMDNVFGGDGADYLDGQKDRDFIFGEAGDDNLRGGDGNDYLDGGSETDYIKGEAGNDTLIGGTGRDNLFGGIGDDTLTGGSDYDFFLFYAGDGSDVITDFEQGDTICYYNGSSFGDLSISQNGNDVIIQNGDIVINVQNSLIADFDANDFAFL